jgi:hypothetical protein
VTIVRCAAAGDPSAVGVSMSDRILIEMQSDHKRVVVR